MVWGCCSTILLGYRERQRQSDGEECYKAPFQVIKRNLNQSIWFPMRLYFSIYEFSSLIGFSHT